MSTPTFFAELKRRNVIRAAGLYLVGAWLITQVASTILPMFGAPDWLPRAIPRFEQIVASLAPKQSQ